MYLTKTVEIDNIIVREEVCKTKFFCDLNKCKGACCTLESEFGAPIDKKEIEEINKILPIVLEYLSEEHKNEILKNGFWEDKSGELFTRSVNNKSCVFVRFEENNIAKCAIERAYYDQKVAFKKPVSCHLFPIRISHFGGDILRYEEFSECKPALETGKKENTTIAEFCKDALIRRYGNNWYEKLKDFIGS